MSEGRIRELLTVVMCVAVAAGVKFLVSAGVVGIPAVLPDVSGDMFCVIRVGEDSDDLDTLRLLLGAVLLLCTSFMSSYIIQAVDGFPAISAMESLVDLTSVMFNDFMALLITAFAAE